MLANVMDFDPRIICDGGSYGVQHGWHCNFHFGHGHDIIDEDAKDEKSCVQVLGFMIAKADAEIHELEDELALLQCQLKWAESDKQKDPYEISCSVFKQKISSLTSKIQSLRSGIVSSGNDMDTALNIQNSYERICDIISALIRHDFSESDGQVGDLFNGDDLLVNSGSLHNDTDLEQQAASLETIVEFKEHTTVIERHEKPANTSSEESSSAVARYATEDSDQGKDIGKSQVEVAGEAEFDAYECTSEGNSEFLFSLKSFMTQTHLQASTCKESTKSDVLRDGETDECIAESEIGRSSSSLLSAIAEVTVKAEIDDHDIDIQHVVDSLSKSREREDPVEDNLRETKTQSQNIASLAITYGRKKSSLSSLLKQQEQEVPRKLPSSLGVIEESVRSLMLKPQGKIGKKKPGTNADSFRQGKPPKVEGGFPLLRGTSRQKKLQTEPEILVNPSQVVGAKRRRLQGTSREKSLASNSPNRGEISPGIPSLTEAKGSIVASDPSKRLILEDIQGTASLTYNLENLKLKLSQDPNFLKRKKVSELREIMTQNELRGPWKFTKEKLIEHLTKLLSP